MMFQTPAPIEQPRRHSYNRYSGRHTIQDHGAGAYYRTFADIRARE